MRESWWGLRRMMELAITTHHNTLVRCRNRQHASSRVRRHCLSCSRSATPAHGRSSPSPLSILARPSLFAPTFLASAELSLGQPTQFMHHWAPERQTEAGSKFLEVSHQLQVLHPATHTHSRSSHILVRKHRLSSTLYLASIVTPARVSISTWSR